MASDDDDAKLDHALEAMDLHQQSITYPILYDLGERLAVLGSGVLFQLCGRHFILTAAHLFDEEYVGGLFDSNKLAGPDTRGRGNPTTFGPTHLYRGSRAPFDFDIAAIELLDPSKIERIKKEWTFLSLTDLSLPTNDPLFCLAGYPTDLQAQRGSITHGPLLIVRALALPTVPDAADQPVDLKYDFFGGYDRQGMVRQLANKVMPSPALQGVSGGSLLQYNDNVEGVWFPTTSMKLVGIQSGASDLKQWFRAKKCNSLALLFAEIEPKLGEKIRNQLGLGA